MPYQAVVYKVMIASPSDVSQERQIVRDVIADWTAVHSVDRRVVLLPVAWESHASPEMGDRPQAIINRQLLKDCDLLVAVFWTRIGSPTGVAVSGTIEEIEEHIEKGRPAMIYFSDMPIRPGNVDMQQYEELKAFKEQCRQRGLYESYSSLQEFRDKLTRQLATTMIRLGARTVQEPLTASDFVLGPASPVGIQLTATAKELLSSAVIDGSILRSRIMGGTQIRVGKKLLNQFGNARDTARWEAAVRELSSAGLIEQTDSEGAVFQVTHEGYSEADRA